MGEDQNDPGTSDFLKTCVRAKHPRDKRLAIDGRYKLRVSTIITRWVSVSIPLDLQVFSVFFPSGARLFCIEVRDYWRIISEKRVRCLVVSLVIVFLRYLILD